MLSLNDYEYMQNIILDESGGSPLLINDILNVSAIALMNEF